MIATRSSQTVWSVGSVEVVRQDGPDCFQITSSYSLTEEKLKRLHEVLGEVLTDLAEARMSKEGAAAQ